MFAYLNMRTVATSEFKCRLLDIVHRKIKALVHNTKDLAGI